MCSTADGAELVVVVGLLIKCPELEVVPGGSAEIAVVGVAVVDEAVGDQDRDGEA